MEKALQWSHLNISEPEVLSRGTNTSHKVAT